MIKKRINALFNPEVYHGWSKKKSYFEGWYFKIITADEKHAFAIIPGVAMDNKGDQHSFIQMLDGKNNKASYLKYDFSEFRADPKTFNISINKNQFSKSGITLNTEKIQGKIEFDNLITWPSQWYSPGIMGPFSFVPFMQCYHGIVSMNHTLSGTLCFNGNQFIFNGGKGYLEKDWGTSFPQGYIWMQSNHFSNNDISLKSSVARIPWLGSSFTGYIAGLYLYDRLIEFTTYNLTRLRKCQVTKTHVELVYENSIHRLEIQAKKSNSTTLAAPIQGFMDGRINESMTSELSVKLTEKRSKKILLDDIGRNAGLEIAGDLSTILK